jgi:hypothetical protein
LNDAVVYLNMVIGKGENTPVHMSELRGWAIEFGFDFPGDLLIERTYVEKYQSNWITL